MGKVIAIRHSKIWDRFVVSVEPPIPGIHIEDFSSLDAAENYAFDLFDGAWSGPQLVDYEISILPNA
jgi:hypothetical protein